MRHWFLFRKYEKSTTASKCTYTVNDTYKAAELPICNTIPHLLSYRHTVHACLSGIYLAFSLGHTAILATLSDLLLWILVFFATLWSWWLRVTEGHSVFQVNVPVVTITVSMTKKQHLYICYTCRCPLGNHVHDVFFIVRTICGQLIDIVHWEYFIWQKLNVHVLKVSILIYYI